MAGSTQLSSECEEYLKQVDSLHLERTDWSTFGIADTMRFLDDATWLCKQLSDQDDDDVEDSSSVVDTIRSIRRIIEQIEQFSFDKNQTKEQRNQIQSQLRRQVSELIDRGGPWATIRALQSSENPSSEAHRELEKIKQVAGEVVEKREEVERAAEGARVAAQKSGASVFTKEFQEEAERSLREGKRWLWPAGGLAVASLGVAAWMIASNPADEGWEWFYGIGARFFVLSVLIYAATWCSRVSLAKFHLASVNRHRALSIRTLQAFRESAVGEAAKDAVALEAARAVYEHVATGYLLKGGTDRQPTSRTLEVMRPLGSGGES